MFIRCGSGMRKFPIMAALAVLFSLIGFPFPEQGDCFPRQTLANIEFPSMSDWSSCRYSLPTEGKSVSGLEAE